MAHYLDPTRRSVRGRTWSLRRREEQQAYCTRFVTPVIADVELSRLSRVHFARILAQAPTASVAAHLRRCCSAMVAAGLEEGLLLARPDVLRGVHWSPPAGEAPTDDDTPGRFIDEADIPTATAVATLASAATEHSRVWWRELQVLVVAYSGLRWGEMAALTADQVDVSRRCIVLDRQVVETRHQLCLGRPRKPPAHHYVPGAYAHGHRAGPHGRAPAGRGGPRRSVVPLAPGTLAPALQLPAQHLQSRRHRGGMAPEPLTVVLGSLGSWTPVEATP